ncbi:TAT-variant-translocated molybdopterin oxidoreductase [Fimbriiglobus ruber]|uniref:Molybdopterin oxidoreductase, iron-sulfur binding subunit n=1 Tax=Fimbriiglobus ruber TaxID=1908690 RepID=A0A225D3W6_9BACT|nr:TAT-variant-translocated molybdopterin oxidoreductase [Fimbriiglobus ruber]OWK36192.1 Molybdopterin oxidoreductase, iron-sulfur binding subunit [Fimbriiglobus ruber]
MPSELKLDAAPAAPPRAGTAAGRPEPEFWQSIDQWMDTPQFRDMMKDEFPEDAAEWLDPVSRRQFLSLMGASVALAGAVGCNPSLKPASRKKVVPFVRQPDQMIPGVPLFFSTAVSQAGGIGLGVLVKSVEGRPIKVEGNPNHPGSLGATDLYAQASILGVYDPDRSKQVKHEGRAGTFDSAIDALRSALNTQKAKQGEGLRIVTETTTSPTLILLIEDFLKRNPKAKWVQYETLSRDNPRRAGERAFGKYVNPIYHFDKAKVALALDSDFLSATGPGNVRYAREFMAGRKVREIAASLKAGDGVEAKDMNRLYAVESMLTSTGGTADHRLPLKPSEVEAFAVALAKELGVAGLPAGGKLPKSAEEWIKPLAADLSKAKGQSVVVVGDHQPPAVHLLAHAINEKLGAFGSTVTFTEPVETRPADQLAEFKTLVADLKGGKVDFLFLLGGNPAFDAPADLEFAKVLGETKALTVHLGLYDDETSRLCKWHLNAAHEFETWGDVRGFDGTATIQQPLIAPLFGGKSPIELFAVLLELGISDSLEVVKATWKKHFEDTKASGDFETWWQKAVRDGVIPGTARPAVNVGAVKLDALNDKAFATPAVKAGTEIQFRPDPTIYDGRYANNGWLQEIPKPVSKLAWDNAAIVSPATAEKLQCTTAFGWTGGENGRTETDLVEITVDGRKLTVALFILPGHADDVITLYVGYGRSDDLGWKVAGGHGSNTYLLRTTTALWGAGGVEVKKTSGRYLLAALQGQHAMESRRPVRHATVAQFAADHDFAQVPGASAGEYKEIRALTPGTPEDFARLYGWKEGEGKHPHPHYHTHDHGHAHEGEKGEGHEEHGGHDTRLIPLSLYPQNPLKVDGQDSSKTYRRWGMSIDLGACTGCSACVVACVSENNIPVVGKEQVTKGRSMHWIRIDRYFSMPGEKNQEDSLGGKDVGPKARAEKIKDSAAIRTHFQPVQCQQCEKAPCEVVCPPGATVHSADGLNDMVYNRCVGTRYCSNNCPYKVRRFNFLQFSDYSTESLKLVNNPDVTVRTRGVMEKCTYCVQRIRAADVEAEREFQTRPKDANGRPKIRDHEIVTACQAACPTGAIVFGDINDRDSAVLRAKAEPTTYGLLAEINTMPRTSFLAAVRNPNPAMPKGA